MAFLEVLVLELMPPSEIPDLLKAVEVQLATKRLEIRALEIISHFRLELSIVKH